jgi:hypothetical protein
MVYQIDLLQFSGADCLIHFKPLRVDEATCDSDGNPLRGKFNLVALLEQLRWSGGGGSDYRATRRPIAQMITGQ